jgi:hypothetical protein
VLHEARDHRVAVHDQQIDAKRARENQANPSAAFTAAG